MGMNVAILFLTALCTGQVTLVTSDSVIRMPHDSGEIRLIFRNAGCETLLETRLAVAGEAPLQVKVRPEVIERCEPGDRCVFVVYTRKSAGTPSARFPLEAVLSSRDRPQLYRARLLVDSRPEAGRRESGWLQAGTVKVTGSSRAGRLAVLALACAIPLVGLLVWGIYLKKKARKK